MSFFLSSRFEGQETHHIELRWDTGIQEIFYEISVFCPDDRSAVHMGLDIKSGFVRTVKPEKNVILVVTDVATCETLYQDPPIEQDEKK